MRLPAAVWVLYFGWLVVATGITPTGELKIRQSSTVIYVAPSANFGADLSSESETAWRKLVEPSGDEKDGCNPTLPHLNKNAQVHSSF
jgi:hypothetical protein